jgi:hypothetical protein
MVVEPVVEVMVEPPLVMTVTSAEVVMAEDDAAPDPPAPAPPPTPPVELPEPPEPLAASVVAVTVTEAPVLVVVVMPDVAAMQSWLAQSTALEALVSSWQCW